MIGFRSGELLAIGLSKPNLKFLATGKPIVLEVKNMQIDDLKGVRQILIFGGKDNESMANDIAKRMRIKKVYPPRKRLDG